ncbi:hypothetical protein RFI_14303 [Reticulomyxa filosa]|uniref:Uncharacterized protein n=1 Tax=Reticulomyxa filosa TaxID=46433 RepID=X6N9E1_RETFI|nr:hypothetical protein RFI_14303 [Reticulomyxa filosa]|eukprot:ETO22890.1 hypothetical protein RFI_14303 [Reticulomyxa filosa]
MTQAIVAAANVILRVIMCLWFVGRYPRANLTLMTFPFLTVISSLTYSIRVYELLEMGENKEYDGYRYYRSWMWSSLLNVPFTIAGLALVLTGSPGLDAVSIVVLVLNLLNVGRNKQDKHKTNKTNPFVCWFSLFFFFFFGRKKKTEFLFFCGIFFVCFLLTHCIKNHICNTTHFLFFVVGRVFAPFGSFFVNEYNAR